MGERILISNQNRIVAQSQTNTKYFEDSRQKTTNNFQQTTDKRKRGIENMFKCSCLSIVYSLFMRWSRGGDGGGGTLFACMLHVHRTLKKTLIANQNRIVNPVPNYRVKQTYHRGSQTGDIDNRQQSTG
jgi:hypothetical protein